MEKEESLESKCENLMNIVVESRKRFGKTCVDYNQKILLMEKKILNLQLETISQFKPKTTVVSPDVDTSQDIDDFIVEITDRQRRLDDLIRKLDNTRKVVIQLKYDVVVPKKLRVPLTGDAILAKAKAEAV